jgi:hypothetical protein
MPTDPRDYKLDVSGVNQPAASDKSGSRPFLSVHFACCGVYCRIYRNSEGTAYVGQCPRCGRPVRFLVGLGGTDQRFFVVE